MKEEFVKVTLEKTDKLLCNSEFRAIGVLLNYQELVNSKIRKHELGFLFKNNKRIRYIVRRPSKNIRAYRKEMMEFWSERFPAFVPATLLSKPKAEVIGKMFGCTISLK